MYCHICSSKNCQRHKTFEFLLHFFWNLWFAYVLFFANLHINVKTQTTKLWHKCLLLCVLYPRFFSTYGDLESISFFVFITFYTFCCRKVKPGSMQNIINVYFVHEYNIIFIILQKAAYPLLLCHFNKIKISIFEIVWVE